MLIIVLALFCIGCSNFFVKDNKPKTIQDNSVQNNKEMSSLSDVKDFKSITQGIIGDISSQGENIVLLREDDIDIDSQEKEEDTTYNLSLYNLKEEKIYNIISSPINLFLNRLDATEEGVYFLENKEESLFNYIGLVLMTIKSSYFFYRTSSKPSFYVKSNNEVYYGTKDGKIIRANENILRIIDIGSDYNIFQIYFLRIG